MKSPAFSFYVRDWLCSNFVSKLHSKSYSNGCSNILSRCLNAYLFLLLQSWIQEPCGTLPNDDTELADLARVSPQEWQAMKPLIMLKLQVGNDGRLFNERLMAEVIKQQNRIKAGSIGGSKKEANKVAALEVENEIVFNTFWQSYPCKVGKFAARKAWDKIDGAKDILPKMLETLETEKRSAQWKKENGQFIPHPSTWLDQGRWMDEKTQIRAPEIPKPPKPNPPEIPLEKRKELWESAKKKAMTALNLKA